MRVFVAVVGLLLATVTVGATAEHGRGFDRVLFLHSYHPDFVWTRDIDAGFRDALRGWGADVEVVSEHLDAKRHPDEAHVRRFLAMLSDKYRTAKLSALACSDDHALALLVGPGRDFFPDLPVVFCGVNAYDPEMRRVRPSLTGVIETVEDVETAAVACRLHPDMTELVAVLDDTRTGRALQEAARRHLPRVLGGRTLRIVGPGSTLDELGALLRGLRPPTVVLFYLFNEDVDGCRFTHRRSFALLHEGTRVPFYGVWDFYMGQGLVGGRLASGRDQGRAAAGIMHRILGGEGAGALPVVRDGVSRLRFDHRELLRHCVDPRRLPPEAEVEHRPAGFTERHGRHLMVMAGLVPLLLVVILLLERSRRRRTLAERALRVERELLSTTLASIGDGVVTVDGGGGIISANDAACRLLAVHRESLVGGKLRDRLRFCPAEDGNPTDPDDLVRGEGERPDLCLVNDRGEKRWVSIGIYPLSADPEGAVWVLRDVTETRALHERIRQAEKLESIGRLAGGVAHDFNNMLAGITGFSELLMRRLPENGKEQDYARRIFRSSRRAADLTRQLLAFSRKGKLLDERVDVHAVVDDAMAILERTVDRRIRIETIHGDERFVVLGDAAQIENAILNLAVNGADAMPEGGLLRIETRRTRLEEGRDPSSELGELAPGDYVELVVRDEGCGMDEATAARAFDPFFTTKAQGKGTGLGLSAVYGTVREHGGGMIVRSRPGAGTTMRIYLPLADVSDGGGEPEQAGRTEILRDGSGRGVLVVDDEDVVRLFVREALEAKGYRVWEAEDGAAAVEVHRRHRREIDCVLLDLVMPRLDGARAFKALREENPDLDVLIMTGHDPVHKAGALVADGAAGLLRKPIGVEALLDAVGTVLARRRA